MGHAMRRAAAGLQGFNPITGVGWTHAYWAEGPEFVALGLSDGGAVATWPDEIGTDDLTQSTAGLRPTYRTAGTINSVPAVRGDGTQYYRDVAFASAMAQPHSTVVITRLTSVAGTWATIIDGTSDARAWLGVRVSGTLNWNLFAGGGVAQAGTPAANTGYMLRAFFSGSSSLLDVNGTNVVPTGTAVGTQNRGGISLFNSSVQLGQPAVVAGDIAFVGVFNGDVTGDPKWAQFKTWVTSHYGITIA